MAIGESLFERLRHAGDRQPQTLDDDRNKLVGSIANNLQRILASREGHAPAQMDYGIPAPSEIAQLVGDSVETMQALIKRCIEKYEPRLRDVQVLYVETEDAQRLVFSVRGRLTAMPDDAGVSFDSYVDETGQLRLRH